MFFIHNIRITNISLDKFENNVFYFKDDLNYVSMEKIISAFNNSAFYMKFYY